jgi:CBS domain-containing protein
VVKEDAMDLDAFRRDAEAMLGSVGGAMTPQPLTFEPETRASDAALRLASEGVAGAPVVDHGRVVGVVALSDLLTREGHQAPQTSGPFLRGERHLATMTVREVMTPEPVTIRAAEPLVRAIDLIDALGVNRLPVVDDQGFVIGIIARDDVIHAIALTLRALEPMRVHPGAPALVPD